MKRIVLMALAASAAMGAMADITVNFQGVIPEKEYAYRYSYISDVVKPRGERPAPVDGTATVKENSFSIQTVKGDAAQYLIMIGERQYIPVYLKAGENVTITVTSDSPLAYTAKGTQLMADVADMDTKATALSQKAGTLSGDAAAMEALENEYNSIFTDYIAQNPDSPAVAFAMQNLEGEDFMAAYDSMTPSAKESILYPMVEQQRNYVMRQMESDRKKAALQSGDVDAPDFTFQDMEGKNVSLSDFRGKWVIIDFWGSWCPWCIKGFPKLKEAYAAYAPKLEVVGVACNDPKEAWEKAVKKYELPWVSLYNSADRGGKILEDYAVEGFPTKVIVNPEGKIVNITVGEDPKFFEVLAGFMK